MPSIAFVTHPEMLIDPSVPAPEWRPLQASNGSLA